MSDFRRCRHCRVNKACRPRRLCFGCYYTPAIRALYPVSSSPHAHVGVAANYAGPSKKPRPVRSLPGSAERIKDMAARAAKHQSTTDLRDNQGDLD